MDKEYLLHQDPKRALLIFALPMIIGNIFQQLYTIADSAIVGRFVGEQALAAVGASYAMTNIFIFFAIGGGIGASVIVSHLFGARDYRAMKTASSTAILTFLVVSLILGTLGWVICEQLLLLLNTPTDVLAMATEYLKIYFIGLPFLFMYNIFSAMFNALGRSKIPLGFLIFSSVFNIILDYIFVAHFGWGVPGVAWATCIAQGISALLCFVVFLKVQRQYLTEHTPYFSMDALTSMTRIAVPSILQQSTISIGLMLVQSVVNGFGSEVLAGFSAGSRVEALFIVPMSGIGTAVSSFTAQNLGARKIERIHAGCKAAIQMVLVVSVITAVITTVFHTQIIQFFLGADGAETALATGKHYVFFEGFFYCFIGFKMVFDGILRGAGDMIVFTIANLANLFFRVSMSILLAPIFGVAIVWYMIPIGWIINWVISGLRYKQGVWKDKLKPQKST